MIRSRSCVSIALCAMACSAAAQSTGSFSSPSTGSGAAGSSPVGTVLPYTVQSGSTAPTQPGHTITGDRARTSPPTHASSSERGKDDDSARPALADTAKRSP